MAGDLWLSVMPASAKARDLHRDPRILAALRRHQSSTPGRDLRFDLRKGAPTGQARVFRRPIRTTLPTRGEGREFAS